MNEQENFRRLLSANEKLPLLFVGSGLSLRYLGLPNWSELLRHFAKISELNFDHLLATTPEGELSEIARKIGETYTNLWYEDSSFESLRAKYSGRVNAPGLALKFGVSDYLQSKTLESLERIRDDNYGYLEEIELLRKIKIEGIVTTNYDEFLETIFPDFVPYIGQQDLLFSDAHFVGEIYKIHGSVAEPSSLVLDSHDYSDFSKKNRYLVSKLLTIFAERPIIFLGYSLTDKYVKQILSNLVEIATGDYLSRLSERLIQVQWDGSLSDDEAVISTVHFSVGEVVLPMTQIKTNSFSWIYEVLSELERSIPAATVRQIRSQVYEVVRDRFLDGDLPEFRVIEISDSNDSSVRTIFGFTIGNFDDEQVGRIAAEVKGTLTPVGYRGITLEDLVSDILGKGKIGQLNSEHVLTEALPALATNANAPLAKYLSDAGWIDDEGKLKPDKAESRLGEMYQRRIAPPEMATGAFRRASSEGKYQTLASLKSLDDLGITYRLSFPLLIDVNGFTDSDLLDFILWVESELTISKAYRSFFRKLVAYYDRLKFQPGYRDRRQEEIEKILVEGEALK